MITAKIGDTVIKIASTKDAETLLNIFGNAEALSHGYDVDFNEYYYPADGKVRISVEISNGENIVTKAEHEKKRAAREEKSRSTAITAALTTEPTA